MPKPSDSIPQISIKQIIGKYEAVLFDAFGVLLDASGALPGSIDLIERLNRDSFPYFILTNGASGTIHKTREKYKTLGFNIPGEKIVTSGSLIAAYLQKNKLISKQCFVLGPPSSKEMVAEAGGIIADRQSQNIEAIIICDQSGVAFPEDINFTISLICQKIDANESICLLLPNPDLIYPAGSNSFGITAGSIALIVEEVLQLRYPKATSNMKFERLGKPYRPIFSAAFKATKTMNMALIGDQIVTDVAGANSFGIDSILISTGITKVNSDTDYARGRPTHTLNNLIW